MPHLALPTLRRLATLALLSSLVSTAMADPGPRPFKARLQVTESVMFTGAPPCFGIGTITATGNASQLGNVTVASRDCINPVGLYVPGGSNSFAFVSLGAGSSGMTFTAANGDRLFATYAGLLTARLSGPHVVTGTFIITGGTGNYAGASGSGLLTGHEDISQGTSGFGQIEIDGTIVY